jgi:hypothetical protein
MAKKKKGRLLADRQLTGNGGVLTDGKPDM